MTATFTLRARWGLMRGPPATGEFLKAPRGRTAYEIIAVRRIDSSRNKDGYNFALTCARWNPGDVPDHAIVHVWHWDKR